MTPFDGLLLNLKSKTTQSYLKNKVANIIMVNSAEVINMVKNRMKYGESVDGGKIGRYASREYAEIKHQQNPLAGFGNVDLFLTGELNSKITIKRESNKLVIWSSDEKYGKLAKKYGAEEFGLTETQMNEFLQECYYIALESLTKEIYGK